LKHAPQVEQKAEQLRFQDHAPTSKQQEGQKEISSTLHLIKKVRLGILEGILNISNGDHDGGILRSQLVGGDFPDEWKRPARRIGIGQKRRSFRLVP